MSHRGIRLRRPSRARAPRSGRSAGRGPGRSLDRSAPCRSSSSRSTVRSARTGWCRRCARRPGSTYTGSGVAASAVGMDKVIFKRIASAIGIPVVPWIEVAASEWRTEPAAVQRRIDDFAVGPGRPARDGQAGRGWARRWASRSSITPTTPSTPAARSTRRFAFGDAALVEAYLDHPRELEMSVVGNSARDLQTFGPGEIFPGHEFYDYSAKYAEGVSRTSDRPAICRRTARSAARLRRPRLIWPSAPRASRASTSCSPATSCT